MKQHRFGLPAKLKAYIKGFIKPGKRHKTLALPKTVQALLTRLEIAAEPVETSREELLFRSADEHRAKPLCLLIPLKSEQGVIQTMLCSHSLLNLDMVSELVGSPVGGLTLDARSRILNKLAADHFAAVPQLINKPLYVDSRLFSAERLLLDCGQADVFAEISADDFVKLTESCTEADISIALDRICINEADPDNDEEDIHVAIRNYTSLRIRQSLSDTLEIPPLSNTAKRIIELAADPNADAHALVDIVELDAGLSAQVVGWAASPYYSAPGKVNSIQDAIVRVLGFELVLNLALGLAVGKALALPKDNPEGITPYWLQSVYCALMMETLNEQLSGEHKALPGLVYLTGLLNNFGYLILAHVFPSHFSVMCRYLEVNWHVPHPYIEAHLLGLSRDQINAELLKNWHLPKDVYNAIRFQQCPEHDRLTGAISKQLFVSKRLLQQRGIGDLHESYLTDETLESMGITQEIAQECLEKVLLEAHEIERMVDIMSG